MLGSGTRKASRSRGFPNGFVSPDCRSEVPTTQPSSSSSCRASCKSSPCRSTSTGTTKCRFRSLCRDGTSCSPKSTIQPMVVPGRPWPSGRDRGSSLRTTGNLMNSSKNCSPFRYRASRETAPAIARVGRREFARPLTISDRWSKLEVRQRRHHRGQSLVCSNSLVDSWPRPRRYGPRNTPSAGSSRNA